MTADEPQSDTSTCKSLVDNLNPNQREAVEYIHGPLLIFAGAGSGKTRVLTHRVAHMVADCGVFPRQILAVTFTNKAAQEMKERIVALVGPESKSMWIGTFHSTCSRLLREAGDKIGIDRNFLVYDDGDQLSLIKECLSEMHLDPQRFAPRAILSHISRAKEKLIAPDNYAEHFHGFFEDIAGKVYERYQSKLKRNQALDFDDLLMMSVRLLEQCADVLERFQNRFHYLMVDEYQDVNFAQYKLLHLLAAKRRNICVVGDDDQSIYMFRGADVSLILQFEKDYPDAKVIKLEQNYRSTGRILQAAYGVVANNRSRADKMLWTENVEGDLLVKKEAENEQDEALWVVEKINEEVRLNNRQYSDFAILYRTNAQSRMLEEVFMNFRTPYRIVGGVRFYERKEVKDVLAYLRVIHNPLDSVSLKRIINVPTRGIGSSTMKLIEDFARERDLSLWDTISMAYQFQGISARAAKSLGGFVEMIKSLRSERGTLPVTQLAELTLKTTRYLAELEEDTSMEAQSRAENVRELLTVTTRFELEAEDRSLSSFLESVALVSDLDGLVSGAEAITLMTLHSAKGLEFPVVFLVGMEEGIFPHSRSLSTDKELEEERRLCYVGITRAERKVYLSHAYRRTLYGSMSNNPPSRFLKEIPPELFEGFTGYGKPAKVAPGPSQRKLWVDGPSLPVSPTSKVAPSAPSLFRAGQKVSHEMFGVGVVLQTRPEGDDLQVSVAFPNHGIKKMLQSIAKLKAV